MTGPEIVSSEPKLSPQKMMHPAFTVSNIRNHVRLVLDSEKVLYSSWAALFTLHACAFKVISFIDGSPRPDDYDDDTWSQLDAIVLQWIYSTLSDDFVVRVLETKSSAREAWLRLENMFRDNKGARATHLENSFINTKLENVANIGEYCQNLNCLADQLKDVDSTVSQQRRVLQLVNGLTSEFDTVGTIIQQTNPLPDFSTARSRLLLEEQRHGNKTGTSGQAAGSSTVLAAQSQPAHYSRTPNKGGRGRGRTNGKGRGRGQQQQAWSGQSQSQIWTGQHQPLHSHWYQNMGQPPLGPSWNVPPCPFPTSRDWVPATLAARGGPGILGPRPRSTGSYGRGQALLRPQATDISSNFNGLTLQPPDDTWYMDTGATSHLTNHSGTLSHVSDSRIPN